MKVHSILATGIDEEQLEVFNLCVCAVANLIDRRGMTIRYTVFEEDLHIVTVAAQESNTTIQGRIEGPPYWEILHKGLAKHWEPSDDVEQSVTVTE